MKHGWKVRGTAAVLLCTSLFVGGQAHAATLTPQNYAVQTHQYPGKNGGNHDFSKPGSADNKNDLSKVMSQVVTLSNTKFPDRTIFANVSMGQLLNKLFTEQTPVKNDVPSAPVIGNASFFKTSPKSEGSSNPISAGSHPDGPANPSNTSTDSDSLSNPSAASPNPDGLSTPSNASDLGQEVIKAGEKYMGTPYQYGSSRSDKSTMDCSEFTMWAFREGAGIDLGRSGARSQYKQVKKINRSDLRVGDLVFFSTRATMKYSADSIHRIGHVGIYAGDDKILHTYGKGGVTYSNMASGWWDDHFVAAGRVLK